MQLRLEGVSKHWGTAKAVDRASFATDSGQARRPARPVGLRQVDDAAHDRRPRRAERGPHPDRRPRRHRRCAPARAPHLDGVPVVRAVPAPERRARTSCSASRCGRSRPPSTRDGSRASPTLLGLTRAARAQALAALGRPAAARRARPRDHRRDAGLPDGRAAVEPRRAAAPGDAARDPRPAAAARHHDGLRHPRPDRGDEHGRPGRAAARRPDRAGRGAGRPLRAAGDGVRGALHRHAADEHHRRARAAPRPQARRPAASTSASSPSGGVEAVVQSAEYLGADTVVTCSTSARRHARPTPLAARLPGRFDARRRARAVRLGWAAADSHSSTHASGLRRDDVVPVPA